MVIASPGNANVSLVGGDRPTTEALFALIQLHGCPRRVATSSQTKEWLRPLLLQTYRLEREHNPLVMTCTQPLGASEGRWALPKDKTRLTSLRRSLPGRARHWQPDSKLGCPVPAATGGPTGTQRHHCFHRQTGCNAPSRHCGGLLHLPRVPSAGLCPPLTGVFYPRAVARLSSREALGG